MKLLLALVMITTLPLSIQAQKGASNKFPTQLRKVLEAASNGFKGLKGKEIKGLTGDVIYASTLTLQGTTENQIRDFDTGGSYMAALGETSSVKEAQALADNWKKRIASIAGSGYELTKDEQSSDEAKQNGYLITSDKVSISIYYIRYKEEESIKAFLLIMRI